MSMSRKDYQLIADRICRVRNSYDPNWDENLFRALDDVAKELAAGLKRDNPRFDAVRFMSACGVQLIPNYANEEN